MKNQSMFVAILLIFFCSFGIAQEEKDGGLDFSSSAVTEVEEKVEETIPINRVTEMAVFPGCESLTRNKKELARCFGQEFGQVVLKYLDTEFPNVNKPRVSVQFQFNVNTNGTISNIEVIRGDHIFIPNASEAMNRAVDYLNRNNIKIKPAKLSDGSKATLIFMHTITLTNPY